MHEREVAQSCPTLRDPTDCSPPGSSIHGIFQERALESGAVAFSGVAPSLMKFNHLSSCEPTHIVFFIHLLAFSWLEVNYIGDWREVESLTKNQEFLTKITFTYLWFTSNITWRRQWHPLQCSCLENPMDGGAWWAAVCGVAKSRTRLSDFSFTFHFHALEKEMATHSSVLAWRIPGTGEPGGLPSMGSHRVRHD